MKNLSELSINELRESFREARKVFLASPLASADYRSNFDLYSEIEKELISRNNQIKAFRSARYLSGGYVGNYEPQKPSILSQIKTFFKNLYA
jgi:hypothetical protein